MTSSVTFRPARARQTSRPTEAEPLESVMVTVPPSLADWILAAVRWLAVVPEDEEDEPPPPPEEEALQMARTDTSLAGMVNCRSGLVSPLTVMPCTSQDPKRWPLQLPAWTVTCSPAR